MYSNDLNNSRYYLSNSQVRKNKKDNNWNSTSWLIGERERRDSGIVALKADLLTKKLKNKNFSHDSLQYSRFSNLKSTKCPEFRRTQYPVQDKVQIKSLKYELQTANSKEIEQLEQNVSFLFERSKQITEIYRNHDDNINREVEALSKMVREIGQRSLIYCAPKKEFRMYSDILDGYQRQKQTISTRKPASRLKTKSSAFKDSNLLQSFKKVTEQEQALMTLKYSEESIRGQGNDTLVEGWQSFQKDSKSKRKKKTQTKTSLKDFEFVSQQIEDRYYESIREEIVNHISSQKDSLTAQYEENVELQQKFQGILDEIVQKIAQQKVEREDIWRDLSTHADQLVFEIADNLTHLKSQGLRVEDEWHEKIRQLRLEYSNRIAEERDQRKEEQKMMVKTMMEVIEFLK